MSSARPKLLNNALWLQRRLRGITRFSLFGFWKILSTSIASQHSSAGRIWIRSQKACSPHGTRELVMWAQASPTPFRFQFPHPRRGSILKSPLFLGFYDSKEGPWENWDPHTEWPPGRQARRCLPDDPLEIGNNAFLLLCFPRILMDHQVSNQDRWNVPEWVIFNLPPFFSLVQFSSAEIASYSVVCRKESTVVLSPGFNLGSTLL